MKTFLEQQLDEGLVKLPPQTEKQIKNFVLAMVYNVVETTIKKTTKPKEGVELQLKALAVVKKRIPARKPRSMPLSKKSGQWFSEAPISSSGLPPNYKIPKDLDIKIILDFKGELFDGPSTFASYIKKGKIRGIAINMQSSPITKFFKETKNIDYSVHNLDYAINATLSSLDHEMTHMIQDILIPGGLSGGHNQITTKADYNTSEEAYVTSKVEFEAYIKTELFQFQQHIKDSEILKLNINVREDMEKFMHIKKSNFLSGIQASRFFKALKNIAPARYKIAVKKFTIEMDKWLKSRSKK